MDQSTVDRLGKAKPNVLVEAYVSLRNKKRDLKKAAAEIQAKMDILETLLLNKMVELGQDGFRAAGQTVYKSTLVTATITDRDQLIAFVKKYDAWQFLDLRANKESAEEYVGAHKVLPPGVALNSHLKVGVRKGN